jgi:serine/threonine-protein kinase
VSQRTDVYALGVICYRVLTGRPAFAGKTLMDTAYAVVNRMPPRPSEAHSSLSEAIDVVLAVAMAKSPEHRFESAEELADTLRAAFDGACSEALVERAARLAERDPWGSVE